MPQTIVAQPATPARSHLGSRPLPFARPVPHDTVPDLVLHVLAAMALDEAAALEQIALALSVKAEQIGREPSTNRQWLVRDFVRLSLDLGGLAQQSRDASA